ncbi:MAG: phosphopantothenoylcysteine decarboxylase [Gammaproteobacteria bacterium]|jgi:phosphopantothenoylcysteine decarboxylase/phosphopantothenate--cysteine ligase|nr:phosphopantothenoylcysteine decarboxylase [Gammaproteobacteria bacterium]
MTILNKKILLGVTGGIAAYKSADLVRKLRQAGAEVRVAMTEAATRLVTPLTFQALSGHQVMLDWEQPESDFAMDHIALARWADVILIAPATADFMAHLAHGFASDVLSTLCLATTAPLVVAPAMNQQMWQHPAVQANTAQLAARGVHLVGPSSGDQACGDVGEGRMVEPHELVVFLSTLFQSSNRLKGKTVLITAGPTQESIDPVRYLSNHSSGKMGYALAQAALDEGAEVIIVTGPSASRPPVSASVIHVTTAQQMYDAVMGEIATVDIFIAAAAVSDYRCEQVATQKIKKNSDQYHLILQRNPDILAAVANLENRPFVFGFAAETENILENARAKLRQKKLDMIAVNDVSNPKIGFLSDRNKLTILWKDGEKELQVSPKIMLAHDVMDVMLEQFNIEG